MADWSELPKELLQLISELLDSELDLLRFRSVCSTWRSSIRIPNPNHHSHYYLPCPNPNGVSFFKCYISKRNLFLINPQQQQQTLHRPWLIKIGKDLLGQTHLWEPLARDSPFPFDFPHVLDFNQLPVLDLGCSFVCHDCFFIHQKVVVATWHGSKPPVFLTINNSGLLAVFRDGDNRWTVIPDPDICDMNKYEDVCVFKGRPYAVDSIGRTVTIGPDLSIHLVADACTCGESKFLVESEGNLLLVDKYLDFCDSDSDGDGSIPKSLEDFSRFLSMSEADNDDDSDSVEVVEWEKTSRFYVFSLDEKEKNWVELKSLGDRVLFLGEDCTFSVSASDLGVPKGDCVIYIDYELRCSRPIECVMTVNHKGWTYPVSHFPGYSKLFWPPPWAGL